MIEAWYLLVGIGIIIGFLAGRVWAERGRARSDRAWRGQADVGREGRRLGYRAQVLVIGHDGDQFGAPAASLPSEDQVI